MPAPSSRQAEGSGRLRALFAAAVRAMDPRGLCAARIAEFALADRIAVLAIGKAAAGMAAGALDALGPQRVGGVVVCPEAVCLPGFEVRKAPHPHPDQRSVAAARALMSRARQPDADQLLALISGGASAMACAPAEGVSLQDKLAAVRAVMAGGGPIEAINTVRKHLSAIKGGRLAAAAAVPMTTLVISDVVGDDLSVIGSGLTVPDTTTTADALAVLERFADRAALPVAVLEHLEASASAPQIPGGSGRRDDRVVLLAGLGALARRAAELAGAGARLVDLALVGEVREVAERVLGWIDSAQPGETLLAAGEPTVRLPPNPGIGGRATQLALLIARRIRDRSGVSVLVAGTDGIDGSSDAAGAVVDGSTWNRARDPDAALRRCDAATALAPAGALVLTGRTGVNHADLLAISLDA